MSKTNKTLDEVGYIHSMKWLGTQRMVKRPELKEVRVGYILGYRYIEIVISLEPGKGRALTRYLSPFVQALEKLKAKIPNTQLSIKLTLEDKILTATALGSRGGVQLVINKKQK